MRYLSFLFAISLIVLSFSACDDDPEPPEPVAPLVQTEPITELKLESVKFNGVIEEEGVGETEVGFVWSTNPTPVIGSSEEVGVVVPNSTTFTTTLEFEFVLDQVYYVRAFGRVGDLINYGEVVQFSIPAPWHERESSNTAPAGRTQAVSFTIDGIAYYGLGGTAIPGEDPIGQDDLWKFNPATNAWTKLADFPGGPRLAAFGFAINGKGYVGCGYTLPLEDQPFKDVWEYDPAANEWTQLEDFDGPARINPAAFVINGKGYVGLGMNNNTAEPFVDFWEYNATTDSWTAKKDFEGPVRGGILVNFSANGKGYTGLGYAPGFGSVDDFWEYDPATNDWTEKSTTGLEDTRRYSAIGFTIENRIFVVGGIANSNGALLDQTWEYDVAEDKWIRVDDAPTSVLAPTGFVIGSKAYVVSGLTDPPSTYLSGFLEFDPLPL